MVIDLFTCTLYLGVGAMHCRVFHSLLILLDEMSRRVWSSTGQWNGVGSWGTSMRKIIRRLLLCTTFMIIAGFMMGLQICLWVAWDGTSHTKMDEQVHGASYYSGVRRSGRLRHLGRLSDDELICFAL